MTLEISLWQDASNKDVANAMTKLMIKSYAPYKTSWTAKNFENDIDEERSYYITAFEDDQLVAFLGYQVVFEVVDITNFSVEPTTQRQGLGRQLWAAALEHLDSLEVEKVLLEVRVDNTKAIAFYQSLGFMQIAIRKNYYTDPVMDALIFEYLLNEDE